MKKRINICLFVSVSLLFISCKTQLERIQGEWVYDEDENKKTGILANLGASLLLGDELEFTGNKCIIMTLGSLPVNVDVKEEKGSLSLSYLGVSLDIKIIDRDTLGVEIQGSTVIYKRKKKNSSSNIKIS